MKRPVDRKRKRTTTPSPSPPSQLDSFVGRREELELLGGWIAGTDRLITVLGPGGIGKTRLTNELVRSLAKSAPALSVRRCDVTAVRDRGAVLRLLAISLQAPAPSDGNALEVVGGFLKALGPALLVIDNCEQVVEPLSAVVHHLLESAPLARVLTTSREALRLRGERILELPPLRVPSALEGAERSDAFALLVDRIRRVRPDVVLDERGRAALFEIVRAVEGVPLAIELAASRIALLGAPEVQARMTKPLALLSGGARDLADHQRTVRDSVAWSWDLLAPYERRALAQCSVFRGGFTLRAAEAVLDRVGDAGVTTVDVLQSLREKSMLQERASNVPGAERRFGVLETVRAFAAENLEAQDVARMSLRHARVYARELVELGERMEAGHDPTARALLGLETENVRILTENMLGSGDPAGASERALVALDALSAVDPELLSFTWSGLAEHLERALDGAPVAPSATRARGLLASGNVRVRAGPISRARAEFEAALSMATAVGDRKLEGRALAKLSMLGGPVLGNVDPLAALARAIEIHREVGDRRYEAWSSLRLGLQRGEMGQASAARGNFEQSLRVARAIGDARIESQALSAIGVLLSEQEDDAAALHHLEAAWARSTERDPMIVCALGMANLAAGRLDAAHAALETGVIGAMARGDRYADGLCRGFRGMAQIELGNEEKARADLARACALFEEIRYPRYGAFFLAHLATLDAEPSGKARAAAEVAAARSLLEAPDDPLRPCVECQAKCVELATEDDPPTDDAWARGMAPFLQKGASHRIVELRLSLRIAAWKARSLRAPTASSNALVVAETGRWFVLPATEGRGSRIDCQAFGVVQRLLSKLATARVAGPGEPVSSDELIEAAWPGEKIQHYAGKNRLKVHIAKLRALGLREIILSSQSGYWIDPTIDVRLDRAP